MEKLLRQFNLTPPEILVFKTLLKSGGATVSEIARSVNIKRTSCQETIRLLEDRGLLLRSKIGNKYLYQTEDPDTFAQIVNERQFLVDKIIQNLDQKPEHKSWSVRAITSEESNKILRRAKRKDGIDRPFGKGAASFHILANSQLVLKSTDIENPAIEIKSEELAIFHLGLLKS